MKMTLTTSVLQTCHAIVDLSRQYSTIFQDSRSIRLLHGTSFKDKGSTATQHATRGVADRPTCYLQLITLGSDRK